jgi:hypothetical protein
MTEAAPAPSGGDTGAPAPAVALETLGEAASNRFAALQADKAFGAKVIAGDHEAKNLRSTLIQILHGPHDDAAKATLAESIGLKPRPTVAAAQRAASEAAAAADARTPQFSHQDRTDHTPAGLANVSKELGDWTAAIGLPPSIAKTVTQAIVSSGVRSMDRETYAAWSAKQDAILLAAAHNDADTVKAWKEAAAKVLAAGKFNFENSPALHSAQVIRSLALAASVRK